MLTVFLATILVGQPLAVTSTFAGAGLVVKNVPGARVPKIKDCREPVFSPDHWSVTYWKSDSNGTDCPIQSLDLVTGKIVNFNNGNCRSPGWSPDGEKLFFTRFQGNHWRLIFSPTGAKSAVAFPGGEDMFMPVWSPKNAALVVQDMKNVYWIDRQGKKVRTVAVDSLTTAPGMISSSDTFTDRPGQPTLVAFTQEAKGDKAVVDKMTGLTGSIFLYDLKKKARVRLTGPSWYAQSPRWSKDGQWVYFRSLGPKLGIYRVSVVSKAVEKVASESGEFSL